MQLEKQVCSLEQAKKLKELGIVQSQMTFCFVSEKGKEYELEFADGYSWSDYPCYAGYKFQDAAFTVAELGQMLGPGKSCVFTGEYWTTEGIWGIGIIGNTEAECRASLLIHLCENYKDDVKKFNERLAS